MKKTLITLITILLISLLVIPRFIDKKSATTISQQKNGILFRCSHKPNCVCSQFPDDKAHYIEPLLTGKNIDSSWLIVKTTISKMGGLVVDETTHHIDAIFISRIFRFRDDLTIVRDNENNTIHIRSSSRMGHSDFGVNRKRVERIRHLIKQEN